MAQHFSGGRVCLDRNPLFISGASAGCRRVCRYRGVTQGGPRPDRSDAPITAAKNFWASPVGLVMLPPAGAHGRNRRDPASSRQGSNVASCRYTTTRQNAHVTEEREVFYPWHPWFGRAVHIHELFERCDAPVFRCELTDVPIRRRLEVPVWMFDRAACLHLYRAEMPQVDLLALERLGALIEGRAGQASVATPVIGAGHSSFESRGDADAAREPPRASRATRPIPLVQSGSRVAPPADGGTGDGSAPVGADAEGARYGETGRPDGGRARR